MLHRRDTWITCWILAHEALCMSVLQPKLVVLNVACMQAYMERCAESCAEEFQQQIPKLYQQCIQQLDQLS